MWRASRHASSPAIAAALPPTERNATKWQRSDIRNWHWRRRIALIEQGRDRICAWRERVTFHSAANLISASSMLGERLGPHGEPTSGLARAVPSSPRASSRDVVRTLTSLKRRYQTG